MKSPFDMLATGLKDECLNENAGTLLWTWQVIKPDCLNIEHITKEVFVIAALFMRDYNMYRKKSEIFFPIPYYHFYFFG